jgi:diguanylate cyclase (GGDEF)-like protein/PAS domain S-box-containing protein
VSIDNDKTKQSLADAYMAASPAIFFCWAAEAGWPVEYVSDNVDQLGYNVEELLEGRTKFAEIVHPDDLERVVQEVSEYTEKQCKSFTQHYRLLTRDGGVRWIDDRTVVERDADGKASRYLGIITDITREKVAELALQESESKFRRLVENLSSHHIFYRHDAAGIYTYLSPSIKNVLGFSVQEFLNSHYKEFLTGSPVNHKAAESTRRAIAGEKQPPYELEVRDKGGAVHCLEIIESAVQNDRGDVTALEGVAQDITERKGAEKALQLSQEKYRALVETSNDFVWEVDADGIYTYCSPQVERILGYAPEDMLGKTPFDFMSPEEAVNIGEQFRALAENSSPFSSLENTNLHSEGQEVVLETSGVPFFDVEGNLAGYRGIDRDITERKHAERQLRVQQEFLQSVIDGVHDTIMVIDENCNIQLMNEAARASLNPEFIADIHHPKCHEVFHHSNTPCDGENYPCPLHQVIESGKPTTVVHSHPGADGKLSHVELIATPLLEEDGTVRSVIESARDITGHLSAQQQLEEQKVWLERLAHHDALTGLPNRLLFLDRLQQAIKKAHREDNQLAVLFVDLDRFKQINDSLGHAMGDAVLKAVARRLQGCLREDDVVARLGGDEFTIILDSLHKPQHAMVLAQKLIRSVQRPVRHEDHELYVSASVGISLYPQDGQNADVLLQNADAAMYKAKDEGRSNFQFYTADMTELAFERVLMEAHLHRALEKEQFVVYYQSQVDLHTGKLTGLEALVRWQHPELGLLSPTKFIPLAEDTGLILPLGKWVLQTACRQIAAWHKADLYPGRVAVNLTGNQLKNDKVLPTIEQILEENGCQPDWLELEITESVIMEQHGRSFNILQKIKDLGIELAIDDFGTGYSSLSHLKRLPVSRLKIDRSFIRDIPQDSSNKAITRAVIAMGKSMGLRVIAEGVETMEQKAFLEAEQCDEIQGYIYGPPLPAEQMTGVLSSRPGITY